MDEWVCLSRIDVGRGAVEEGPKELDFQLEAEFGRERKVTRNLKRKHDEINHVQKVGPGEIRKQGGKARKWESLWKQKMKGRMLGLTRDGGGMREEKETGVGGRGEDGVCELGVVRGLTLIITHLLLIRAMQKWTPPRLLSKRSMKH